MDRHCLTSRRAIGTVALAALALCTLAALPPAARAEPAPPVASAPGFDGLHVMPGTPAYAATPLGRLHYWSLGTGPALVLLHQGPLFAIEFAKVMPLLAARGFRVIAVDIPGFGFSQRPDHPATGDEYADSLAALLDQLGIRRASVAGSHTGATVALAFAAHRPERTACLVLQSVPFYSPEELKSRLEAPAPDYRIWADGRHLQAAWQKIAARQQADASPELLQWVVIGTLLSGDVTWYGESTGRTFVTRAYDAPAALRRVKAPTLAIAVVGESLEASTRRAAATRPDIEFAEWKTGRTVVAFDHPQLWADTVGPFVKRRCN